MVRYTNFNNRAKNGIIMRLFGYALVTFIIPFAVSLIRKKLEQSQRLRCDRCHGTLAKISNDKFFCKKCKIVKMDHR